MEYVQLIEKVEIPNGLWMTFWSLNEKARLSLEIRSPYRKYAIGSVYILDKEAKYEKEVLQDVQDMKVISGLELAISLPDNDLLAKRINIIIDDFEPVTKKSYVENDRFDNEIVFSKIGHMVR